MCKTKNNQLSSILLVILALTAVTLTSAILPRIRRVPQEPKDIDENKNGVPFKVIGEGSAPEIDIYRPDAPNCIVLTDYDSASKVLRWFLSDKAVDALDLGKNAYVIITQDQKPTTQFYTTVDEVLLLKEKNEIRVKASFKSDRNPGEKETRPFTVIEFEKTVPMVTEYTFVVEADGREICRQPSTSFDAKPQ